MNTPPSQPPATEEEFVDLEPDADLFGTDDVFGLDKLDTDEKETS